MVNRGPSAGCQTCRERRVGCDKTRPACRKCTMRGQICPGYRDASGIVFKDESKAVFARHSKRAPARPSILPRQVHSNPYDVTTAFFFRHCLLPAQHDWPLGNEYFDHILPLYNSAAPSSALSLAVSVMALKVATIHHTQDYVQHLVTGAELAAVRAVSTALSDPLQRLKDETLMATLCLDFAQQYRNSALQHGRPHLRGALALIQQRASTPFDSKASQSLYVATRGHVLLITLWSTNTSEDQDLIFTLPEVASARESVASAVQHILRQVLCLERQVLAWQPPDASSPSEEDRVASYATWAQALCNCLEGIKFEVSWELSLPFVPLPYGSFERSSDVLLVQKAFVFGQYICTYVLVLKLLYCTRSFLQDDDTQHKIAYHRAILDQAQSLLSSLCVSVVPILDRSRFLRPGEGTVNRIIVTETRPELSNGLPDEGLASTSRSHLVCITTWILGILRKEFLGTKEFGIKSDDIDYLQSIHNSLFQVI
ncbi:unnamed protein product [Periconia digitata]|uniref:Zn(2)-C6 fungal-type domain-containing protein n=1 Tax=Periconia digitata TaxID=1303443 RepID=A0A9W4XVC4_9PLEO|nr:unnamed protein product [Periconia digitata]